MPTQITATLILNLSHGTSQRACGRSLDIAATATAVSGETLDRQNDLSITMADGWQRPDRVDTAGPAWLTHLHAGLIAAMPLVIAFLFAQRYFVAGIALTGSKE